ncbi:SPOSA6832_03985 [Sporobolomyces salmonicolor]|uniref:SPOSA6832_03985-mRNA-1:cds n=1 Tax=Sporidiobolus salmonicolor TaxID=5005 RepID=A0A0D6ERM3_SPOSA|nr:SPOSA6832_03985 [Sporobolomyces salmonicolor]
MLSSLASLPVSLASSSVSFVSSRKKTFAYLAGAVGAAYAAGQWGVARVVEMGERGRREQSGRNDLLHRFTLNLQDSQFTLLALLPTVAAQLQGSLDVESRTKELAEIARRDRAEKRKEMEEERGRREREEAQQEQGGAGYQVGEGQEDVAQLPDGRAQPGGEIPSAGEESAATLAPPSTDPAASEATTAKKDVEGAISCPTSALRPRSAVDSAPQPDSPAVSSPPPPGPLPRLGPDAPSDQSTTFSALSQSSLNPAAPAFQPRSISPPASVPKPAPEPSSSSSFPPLAPSGPFTQYPSAPACSPMTEDPAQEEQRMAASTLGKSWAEIVMPHEQGTAADRAAEVQMDGLADGGDQVDEVPTIEPSPASAPPSGESASEPVPPVPSKSKAQLWHEVKILCTSLFLSLSAPGLFPTATDAPPLRFRAAFTRLLTSLYVLTLITLQTHIQLALLGRAHYVKSLVESLPPRSCTPSPSLSKTEEKAPSMQSEEDLEAALYAAKVSKKGEGEAGIDEDVERKYLTFSWWLLHEGWKIVSARIEEKVQEVVGPMGLKNPIVYGELGALLGEIRRRIESNDDGSPFDFSPALHPPTPSDELHTLTTGGGFPCSAAQAPLITPALRSLLSETSDTLSSPDALLVFRLVLDRLLSLSVEKLEVAFRSSSGEGERGARFEDVTEKQTRLASLLPVLVRLSSAPGGESGAGEGAVLRGGHGNEFVEAHRAGRGFAELTLWGGALEDVRELREFSAIVYGSWDRDNLRGSY